MKNNFKVIYRFEQNDDNGCWYNHDQSFNNLYGKTIESIPMPRDNRNKNYRAGCFSLKDLYTWGTIEALKKMKARVVEVLSNDYIVLQRGEVIYNASTVVYKKVIHQY